jgi:hypothetical protein
MAYLDKEGTEWECRVVKAVRDARWMAGTIPKDSSGGQPFDIWAFHGQYGCMIVCKVVHSMRFLLSCIEDNQRAYMRESMETGCMGRVYILSVTSEGEKIAMIPWRNIISEIDKGKKSIQLENYIVERI